MLKCATRTHAVALSSVSISVHEHQLILLGHVYGAIALHGMPVHSEAFTDTHSAYSPVDGQAELT